MGSTTACRIHTSRRQNLIVCDPTGVGKTFLVCALGTAACRQGYRVRYYRLSRLLQDIAVAKAHGSYSRLARQLASADLLIMDD
ncbi:MAG: ATP-binding protein [Thermoflavifilum sp.]|nr:ATP-binding protein [Thermoflavifilum sp.]MCL6515033.1 ATP-binding protein [Alicyclobacillus sp.]